MNDLVVGRCEFGREGRAPFPGDRHTVVARPVPAIVREALIQARSALITAARDTPADLSKPERAAVIQRRIALINEALAELPK